MSWWSVSVLGGDIALEALAKMHDICNIFEQLLYCLYYSFRFTIASWLTWTTPNMNNILLHL